MSIHNTLIALFYGLAIGILICASTLSANDSPSLSPMIFNPISLKISGSTTVHNHVIRQHEQAVEKQTGYNLQVYPSSSGRGFTDMAKGESDIAMISSDLLSIIEKLNLTSQNFLLRDYTVYPLDKMYIDFLVHPDNPIETLSPNDIVNILTGTIKDWEHFGLSLGEIKVVTEHETGGMYTLVEKELLDGGAITDSALMLQNSPQVAKVMSQLPNGFGFLSSSFENSLSATLKSVSYGTDRLEQDLFFVTKKQENPHIKNVIDSFKTLNKKTQKDIQ